jgi:hypothetical protein
MAKLSQVVNKEELFKQKRRQNLRNKIWKYIQILEFIVVLYLLVKAVL